jgi:pimeloyl-ACP methyl ester carboxylesterase
MGAALALQSAEVEPRIAGVVAEAAFADLHEVSYDYAGLRISHWLGRTVGRPATWMAISGAEKEGGFQAEDVSPEKAVAARSFPVFLICGGNDRNIPCRHSQRIYESAKGPKAIWTVDGAGHAAVLGHSPADYERRVIQFLSDIHNGRL